MFAVVRTGGKQYKVASGDVIHVERLTAETGSTVQLDDVLLLSGGDGIEVGTPVVAGVTVNAEVVGEARGPKLIIFKKKRRQNYRRKRGHRQDYTVLRVTGFARGGIAFASAPAISAQAQSATASVAVASAEGEE